MTSNQKYDAIWEDRDIQFDCSLATLKPRPGEKFIDTMDYVEDTKGNNGDKGMLIVSNIRLIWRSHVNPKTNLSIGFNCIQNISSKAASSKLRGCTESLFILSKNALTRYEFIFTSLVSGLVRLFTSVMNVFKAFDSTRMYRDVKIRNSIIKDGKLMLLPEENVYKETAGVWNLSSDQGSLGMMTVTNVRIVWHGTMNENYNVSLPHLQIKYIRLRETKFGKALAIETSQQNGGFTFGFRIDPLDKLEEFCDEILKLYSLHKGNPVLGVEFTIDYEKQDQVKIALETSTADDIEIDENENQFDISTVYMTSAEENEKWKPPIACSQLGGLAIEPLPENVSIDNLWKVFPEQKNK